MRKIILDTDIGDDIDDSFALLLCLRCEELELLGVTTVYRDTVRRAKMAKALIKAEGKDIEVYAGCKEPSAQPIRLFSVPEDRMDAVPCQYGEEFDSCEISDKHAVDFIIESVHKHGKLTIAAIGPLTNVAAAFKKDSGIIDKVTVVIMGGCYNAVRPEWNIVCDPEAAAAVFNAGCEMYCVGLNVTEKCFMPEKFMDNLKSGAAENIIKKAYAKWKDFFKYEKSVLHDPLAVMSIYKDVVTWEKRGVTADLNGNRGCTVNDGCKKNIFVAVDVNINGFLTEISERLENVIYKN